jgi:hypothetical protein
MPHPRRGNSRVILVVTLVLLVGAAATAYILTRPGDAPQANATTAPATAPAETQPTTASTTKSAKPSPPTTQYLDVVRAHHPRMPVTQPMAVPLELSQAARVVLSEPIYLSPRSDLWITHPDAPPTPEVLARAAKEQGDQLTLTIRERVVFAHWTPQENGPWTFTLVVRGPDGREELVTQSRRTPIDTGRTYHWHRALDWGEKIVVATNTGVSVIHVEPEFREQHVDLIDPKAKPDVTFAEPQFLMDWEGILAWVPWEGKKAGSVGAARFVDDKWSPLGPDQGWPDKLLHLVPLYDGGVLQLVPYEEEWVKLAFTSLEKVAIDEAMVAQLVEKLSDTEDQARQEAFKELTRYGASAWPILEKLMPDQGPEAQARLRQLLKNRVEPTLGGMSLLGDKLRMVARLSDGGAVVYAEVGVATAGDSEEPVIRSPAWISIRPGQAVSLLDPVFTTDMDPDRSRIYALGEEWVVVNNAAGPQRFVGNGFVPLLRKSEVAFSEPIGMDRRGRWLFRKPAPATTTAPATTAPASAPATAAVASDTLVVDPTIPDPTPRLPVWLFTTAETVGWDHEDWPAVKSGGSWSLREDGWRPMKRAEKIFTTAAEIPPPVAPAPRVPLASAPAASVPPAPAPPVPEAPGSTAPVATPDAATASANAAAGPATATAPATTRAEDLGPPILVDKEGNAYFDGRTRLVAVSQKGERVDWPLPPTATGAAAKVLLVRTPDGLLFLYNQAGRMLRIRPTPDEAEPFVLEATFTRNIPSTDDVTRLWVDPAERIIMAYGKKLAIMFPRGYIPPPIALKMPPGQADPEE